MPDSHHSRAQSRELITVLLAGATILLVVHALGRFYFTPLLPYLVADGTFSAAEGANVATWNYFGYLVGALLAIRWHRPDQIRRLLPAAMLVHVITTLMQTQIEPLAAMSALRWVNGVANGIVFVQAPALILEWLVRRNRQAASGVVYMGVGVGLLLTSGLMIVSADWLAGVARWWPAALLSIPLAWWSVRRLVALDVPARPHHSDGAPMASSALLDRASIPLFLSYAGAGLGYILPMTFLPLLSSTALAPDHWLVDGAWILVACVTIPTPLLWNYLGARLGDLRALRLNYFIQFLGALAAVLWPGEVGILLCALLVGSTFVGTVLLTQRIGRALHPHQGPRLSAALVALYGLTQMVGPWLTKQWLDGGGTLDGAFGIGAAALALGLVFAWLVPARGRAA